MHCAWCNLGFGRVRGLASWRAWMGVVIVERGLIAGLAMQVHPLPGAVAEKAIARELTRSVHDLLRRCSGIVSSDFFSTLAIQLFETRRVVFDGRLFACQQC